MSAQVITALLIGLLAINSYADDYHYYDSHADGWHWYAPDDEPENQKTAQPKNSQAMQRKPQSATEALKALQQQIAEAKAKAVLNPTMDNVANYIRLQNQVSAQSTLFAKTWQEVLRAKPNLDYSLQKPTNSAAKRAQEDIDNKQNDGVLHFAAQHYGLFFFFEGKCPYCQKLAPILAHVAKQYDFDVLPISIDGLGLPDYPHPTKNQGQAEKLGVKMWPALFMVDTKTGVISPVTFGLVSQVELKKRLITAAKEITAHEQKNR